MPKIQETRTVSRPRSEVFSYVADFANIAQWDPGVTASERIDKGALRVGSSFTLMVRFGSQQLPMVYSITSLTADSCVELEGVGEKLKAIDEIRFSDAAAGGTRIDYSADLRFKGFLRLLSPFMGRTLRKVGGEALDGLVSQLGESPASKVDEDLS
ncbi:MAG: SRPBCC family protein [Acidimicrobiia bacterium]|nr:SRPBCC family protein [Acidimicrobiia bacterium]